MRELRCLVLPTEIKSVSAVSNGRDPTNGLMLDAAGVSLCVYPPDSLNDCVAT
jgi:hypothetical protein